MTEIEALKYAISHLKDSIEANPVLKVAGQASKAVKRLETMLQQGTGMKMCDGCRESARRSEVTWRGP